MCTQNSQPPSWTGVRVGVGRRNWPQELEVIFHTTRTCSQRQSIFLSQLPDSSQGGQTGLLARGLLAEQEKESGESFRSIWAARNRNLAHLGIKKGNLFSHAIGKSSDTSLQEWLDPGAQALCLGPFLSISLTLSMGPPVTHDLWPANLAT